MPRTVPRLSAEVRPAFIEAVRSTLTAAPGGGAVRWRHRGRDLRGLDCIGLPFFGLATIGVQVADERAYSQAPDGFTLYAELEKRLGPPIPFERAQVGDIPLMRWVENKRTGVRWACHVGVLTPLPYKFDGPVAHSLVSRFCLLHAWKDYGHICESNISEPWDRRITHVFSLTGGR